MVKLIMLMIALLAFFFLAMMTLGSKFVVKATQVKFIYRAHFKKQKVLCFTENVKYNLIK